MGKDRRRQLRPVGRIKTRGKRVTCMAFEAQFFGWHNMAFLAIGFLHGPRVPNRQPALPRGRGKVRDVTAPSVPDHGGISSGFHSRLR